MPFVSDTDMNRTPDAAPTMLTVLKVYPDNTPFASLATRPSDIDWS